MNKEIILNISSDIAIKLKLQKTEYNLLKKYSCEELKQCFSKKNKKNIYVLQRYVKKLIPEKIERNQILLILKKGTLITTKKKASLSHLSNYSDSEEKLLLKLRKTISRFKIMNEKKQQECVDSLFQNTRKDMSKQEGIEKLVLSNLRMNWEIVNKYKNRGVNMLDLFLSSIPGSIKALNRYKRDRNSRPQTYMFWWIMQTSGREIYDHFRLIREPVHKEELLNKISIFRRNYFNEKGVDPTLEQITNFLKISKTKISRILKVDRKVFSLDAKITKLDGNSLHELLIDEDEMNDPKEYLKTIEKLDMIKKVISSLVETQQKVLNFKFGFNNECKQFTVEEISQKLNIDKTDIRLILSNGIKQIKKKLKQEYTR